MPSLKIFILQFQKFIIIIFEIFKKKLYLLMLILLIFYTIEKAINFLIKNANYNKKKLKL